MNEGSESEASESDEIVDSDEIEAMLGLETWDTGSTRGVRMVMDSVQDSEIKNTSVLHTMPPFLRDLGFPVKVVMVYMDKENVKVQEADDYHSVVGERVLLPQSPRAATFGSELDTRWRLNRVRVRHHMTHGMYERDFPRSIWPISTYDARTLAAVYLDYVDILGAGYEYDPMCIVCDNMENPVEEFDTALNIVGQYFTAIAGKELMCSEEELQDLCSELKRRVSIFDKEYLKLQFKRTLEYHAQVDEGGKKCKVVLEWIEQEKLFERFPYAKAPARMEIPSFGEFPTFLIGEVWYDVEYLQKLLEIVQAGAQAFMPCKLQYASDRKPRTPQLSAEDILLCKNISDTAYTAHEKMSSGEIGERLMDLVTAVDHQIRPNQDFTDNLWNHLKKSTSKLNIQIGVHALLERLRYVKALVNDNNPTTLAKAAIALNLTHDDFSVIPYKVDPILLLMEAGYYKLYRDLEFIFKTCDFCEQDGSFVGLQKPQEDLQQWSYDQWGTQLAELRRVVLALEVAIQAHRMFSLPRYPLMQLMQQAVKTEEGDLLKVELTAQDFYQFLKVSVPHLRQWAFISFPKDEMRRPFSFYLVSRNDYPTFEWARPIPYKGSFYELKEDLTKTKTNQHHYFSPEVLAAYHAARTSQNVVSTPPVHAPEEAAATSSAQPSTSFSIPPFCAPGASAPTDSSAQSSQNNFSIPPFITPGASAATNLDAQFRQKFCTIPPFLTPGASTSSDDPGTSAATDLDAQFRQLFSTIPPFLTPGASTSSDDLGTSAATDLDAQFRQLFSTIPQFFNPGASTATDTTGVSAATDAPDISAATDALEVSAVTDAPDISAATNALEVSAVTDAPDISAITDALEVSAATDAPDISAITDALEVSAATDAPDISAITDALEVSAAPDAPDISAITDALEVSAATDAPDISAATDALEVSAATDAPDISAATDALEVSAATDAPDISAATDALEVSAATDAPDISATTDALKVSAATDSPEVSATTDSGSRSPQKYHAFPTFRSGIFSGTPEDTELPLQFLGLPAYYAPEKPAATDSAAQSSQTSCSITPLCAPGVSAATVSPGVSAAAPSAAQSSQQFRPFLSLSLDAPGVSAATVSPGVSAATDSPGVSAAAASAAQSSQQFRPFLSLDAPGVSAATVSPRVSAATVSPGVSAATDSAAQSSQNFPFFPLFPTPGAPAATASSANMSSRFAKMWCPANAPEKVTCAAQILQHKVSADLPVLNKPAVNIATIHDGAATHTSSENELWGTSANQAANPLLEDFLPPGFNPDDPNDVRLYNLIKESVAADMAELAAFNKNVILDLKDPIVDLDGRLLVDEQTVPFTELNYCAILKITPHYLEDAMLTTN